MVANENHTNFMSFRQKNKCMGKSRREGKYDERRESATLMPYQIIFLYNLSIWIFITGIRNSVLSCEYYY